jgi:hypothetical protein
LDNCPGKDAGCSHVHDAQYSTPLIDNPDYEFKPNGMYASLVWCLYRLLQMNLGISMQETAAI